MIEVICRDTYDSYDAYHITAAFYPEEAACGEIRQSQDESAVPAVRVTKDDEEIFSYSGSCGVQAEDLRREEKIRMGQALYQRLSELTGKTLPWGLLTGIRPTKIARRMLEEGCSDDECRERFRARYLISEEKAGTAVEIARREMAYLDRAREHGRRTAEAGITGSSEGLCVYVHIPFCPSRCRYCSFASVPADRYADQMDPYLDALEQEIRAIGKQVRERPVTAVYVGGGTPTSLSAGQLQRLCDLLADVFGRGPGRDHGWLEWTIEAGRPDTLTEDKLTVMRQAGVTRISVNPQTMHDETLKRIGRGHTVQDIRSAVIRARKAGFETVNMDLIAGLEGESPEDFEETLRRLEPLHPDHLTVHALAIKRASLMGQEHRGLFASEEAVNRMIGKAGQWAKDRGLEPYYMYRQKNISGNAENIGYAPSGEGSYYNILIMEEVQDILAFGAGAVSKFLQKEDGRLIRIRRVENVKDVKLYIQQIDEMIQRKETHYAN